MSFYADKPKRKPDEFEGPLDSVLVFLGAKPTLFEFTADTSLDKCADRFAAMDERPGGFNYYFLNRRVIKVEVYRIDDATCQFRIVKKQGKRLPVVVTGYAERQSENSTLITGSAASQHMLWQLLIPLVAIVLLFLVIGFIQQVPSSFNVAFGGWMLFIFGLTVAMTTYDRSRFVGFVEDKLTRPDVPGFRKLHDLPAEPIKW